jgi:amino-acid N-acetyltransferase
VIRKATVKDAMAIRGIINYYADREKMLPRPLGELYDSIRDFFVYEKDSKIIGAAALRVWWEGLAELRSVAVDPEHLGAGIGRELVQACLEDAARLGVGEVFVLTYVKGFFVKLGFKEVPREELPQKIWIECQRKCVKYPDACNESALTLKLV